MAQKELLFSDLDPEIVCYASGMSEHVWEREEEFCK